MNHAAETAAQQRMTLAAVASEVVDLLRIAGGIAARMTDCADHFDGARPRPDEEQEPKSNCVGVLHLLHSDLTRIRKDMDWMDREVRRLEHAFGMAPPPPGNAIR